MFFGRSSNDSPSSHEAASSVEIPPAAESKPSNPLLENLDRTVFTFNMHNLAEMCFQHVVKRSTL